jgi:hypothetical protein
VRKMSTGSGMSRSAARYGYPAPARFPGARLVSAG